MITVLLVERSGVSEKILNILKQKPKTFFLRIHILKLDLYFFVKSYPFKLVLTMNPSIKDSWSTLFAF